MEMCVCVCVLSWIWDALDINYSEVPAPFFVLPQPSPFIYCHPLAPKGIRLSNSGSSWKKSCRISSRSRDGDRGACLLAKMTQRSPYGWKRPNVGDGASDGRDRVLSDDSKSSEGKPSQGTPSTIHDHSCPKPDIKATRLKGPLQGPWMCQHSTVTQWSVMGGSRDTSDTWCCVTLQDLGHSWKMERRLERERTIPEITWPSARKDGLQRRTKLAQRQ